MLHLVGGKHDHRVAIENQQAQRAHNGRMRAASAGAGAKQAAQLPGVEALTPELPLTKVTILKWLLLQREGYNMTPSLSPCFNYATFELGFFKDGEKKGILPNRNPIYFSFQIPCCLLLLFPFKSTSLNAKMDFTIDRETQRAVQELLWRFLLSFFLWLVLNKNSWFSLRLPCVPSAGDPFLSFPFWISSLPTKLISFSPFSSLFLSLTFLLCALPTQTLCPFPFLPFLFPCHWDPFSCFQSQSAFIHSRGGRKEETETQAWQVRQGQPFMNRWSFHFGAQKFFWNKSTYSSVLMFALHTFFSILFPFIFERRASLPLDVIFLVSPFQQNCPSVASWESGKQRCSLGPSNELGYSRAKSLQSVRRTKLMKGQRGDRLDSKELTQKPSVLELLDESANET